MDIFLGKGIYLFPNFKNWPLLFSKSITYIHDIAFKVYPEFTEPRNRTMLNAQISRFLLRSDVIVTVSESSRQEILNHYTYLSKSKVRVVLNGVDTSVFYARNEAEVNKMRKKYALPARYFMFLSNLEPRKNILTLLDAYSRLPENVRFNSALFFVGGMGWLNEDVFKKIEQLELSGCNIIRPSIYVEDDDLPALLTGAVALVHPAFHEGFGMPPLEAIACETPVIISNIPSIREVIGEVGVYLKETTNSEALSQLMLNQYNKTYTKKQKQLLRERADNYRWGATLPELEKIIREV